tara:strand:+ start:32 stop:532 length:501 start_codon:yes stop_codon:yes gene_type:complete
MNNNDTLHFKCLIIDTHKINHKKYNAGDKEIGFYKFYYQLILHCFSTQYKTARFIVKLDKRVSSYSLDDLKNVLNNGFNKKVGKRVYPFANVEAVDSKKSEIMQLNDIILGGIGYIKNGFHSLVGSKKAKVDLADYIQNKSGIYTFDVDTPYKQQRFKIWNFKLKK